METRKHTAKRILTTLMVLALILSLSASAFAATAPANPGDIGPKIQDENTETGEKDEPEEKTEAPKGKYGLSNDEESELKEIYQRFAEIKEEFDALYDTHKDELKELKERAEELEEKAGKFDVSRYFKDFQGMFTEGNWPDFFSGDQSFLPFEGMTNPWSSDLEDSNDYLVPEDKPAMGGEAKTEEKKPHVGILVYDLPEDVSTFTGIQAGVVVQSVEDDSSASKAGIQAYDIITGVDDQEIGSTEELKALIAESANGDTLCFRIFRQGKAIEVDVKIGE